MNDGEPVGKQSDMRKLNLEYSKLPSKVKNWALSKRFVPGDGPLDADIMIVGQAPGKNEDIQKKPFVGISGQFLTRLLSIAGVERKNAYIASVVQFFPPKNRIPTKEEISCCRKFILGQIKIIDPKIIILLGSVAAKTILDTDASIMSLRGTSAEKDGRTFLISIHPAAAIRIRRHMPTMEDEFRNFKKIIKSKIG